RHTRCYRDWSSDVCSSDLALPASGALTRRCTMVGAAKKPRPGWCRIRSKISEGSNRLLSGITCNAAAATCGIMYMPEPCDIGARSEERRGGNAARDQERTD